MHDRLSGLLEKADLALASCAGVVPDDDLTTLIESVRAVRTRLAYPDDILVVALAGGTGSGKSSLFNALNGEELVDVGAIRPTTSEAAASAPPSGVVDDYLARLGVEQVHEGSSSSLCLIDLPDFDSVEQAHRLEADELLAVVDLVVWVVDPEKYRDDRFHREYVANMARSAEQFLFVLNQVDRLDARDVEVVVTDLVEALRADGIEDPIVIPMAAAPVAGPPIGLEDLVAAIDRKRADRWTLYDRLLADLGDATRRLTAGIGPPVDFDDPAYRAGMEAATALVAGDLSEANGVLTGFINDLAGAAGGPTAERLRFLAADIPGHLSRLDAALDRPQRSTWWPFGKKSSPGGDLESARSLIDEAVLRPARVILARRAVAAASVTELALDLQSLRRPAGR